MHTPFYDTSRSLGHLTNFAARLFNARLGRRFAQAELGLTPEQWGALVMLWNGDGVTQQRLADELCLEKSSVSRLVDGLERRGLIRREQDPADARQRRVVLTDKAIDLREASVSAARALLEDAQEDITEAELALCRSVLLRVIGNLSRADA